MIHDCIRTVLLKTRNKENELISINRSMHFLSKILRFQVAPDVIDAITIFFGYITKLFLNFCIHQLSAGKICKPVKIAFQNIYVFKLCNKFPVVASHLNIWTSYDLAAVKLKTNNAKHLLRAGKGAAQVTQQNFFNVLTDYDKDEDFTIEKTSIQHWMLAECELFLISLPRSIKTCWKLNIVKQRTSKLK